MYVAVVYVHPLCPTFLRSRVVEPKQQTIPNNRMFLREGWDKGVVMRSSKFQNGRIVLKIATNTYFSVEILKTHVSSYMEGDEKGGTKV